MNRNSSLCAAALFLITSAWSTSVAAGLVWKGRDGKAYLSVKACFTANPTCRPEHGMTAPSGGVSPSSQSAKAATMVPAVARSEGQDRPTEETAYAAGSAATANADRGAEAPTLCLARGGWMHMPPCKTDAGDVTVRVLD